MGNLYSNEALILGRISLVRSLGRVGIPITLAREGRMAFERSSRYVRNFIQLPLLESQPDEALKTLIDYGKTCQKKSVAFFNGESDVMFFSKHREKLSEYFHIILADHELISSLVDKSKFWKLSDKYNLPTPKTLVPLNKNEYAEYAEKIGYPCILKPIRQRIWHRPEYIHAIGHRKAILINNKSQLESIVNKFPPIYGEVMIQQFIPGADTAHNDYHCYIDKNGTIRGSIVGHKIRTYPIHFGQGCYTEYVDEPGIEKLCLETLNKIGYIGAANINLKRHAITGEDYILEINPRFSLWTILDSLCGVNMPLLQYLDALDMDIPQMKPHSKSQRWLWSGNDFKAMIAYRNAGELTLIRWLKSLICNRIKTEHHIFSWDDSMPIFHYWYIKLHRFIHRFINFIKKF